MPDNKTNIDVVIQTEQKEWLEAMASKHSLSDVSKTLRVVMILQLIASHTTMTKRRIHDR